MILSNTVKFNESLGWNYGSVWVLGSLNDLTTILSINDNFSANVIVDLEAL